MRRCLSTTVRQLSTSQTKKRKKRRFVDLLKISVTGGRGGNGCLSERKLGSGKRFLDGGNGGPGGDVEVVATSTMQSLYFPKKVFKARDGLHGSSAAKHGKKGTTLVLRVPLGTSVVELKPDGEVAASHDLVEHGDKIVVASGGKGGIGNVGLGSVKTFVMNKAAHERAAKGRDGTTGLVELSLKTIADVGLVGFPNAGKSTLLAAMSSSTPRIAAYPFTTIHPFVGAVQFTDSERLSVADIPGLVEGAHVNRGLGHQFLRHVERTKVLVYVLDCVNVQTGSILGDFLALAEELRLYKSELISKPSILVLNKIDLVEGDPLAQWNEEFGGLDEKALQILPKLVEVLPASARETKGIREVASRLRHIMESEDLALGSGLGLFSKL